MNKSFSYIFFVLCLCISAISEAQLKYPVNYISPVKGYDPGKLWRADSLQIGGYGKMVEFPEPIGFIGDDYQRFYIHYTTVAKSRENPYKYNVTGKTRVKNNICSFKGTITIVEAILYKQGYNLHYKQGTMVCNVAFYEDTANSESGMITGKLTTNFYINPKGALCYDALRFASDSFSNNQCTATWTSYKTNSSKKCNWGDYRVSGSKELYAGDGGINSKYVKNGWQSFKDAHSGKKAKAAAARKEEGRKWWE